MKADAETYKANIRCNQGIPAEKGEEGLQAASGVKDTMRTRPTESTRQGPQGLTETEMAIIEPARVYSRTSAYMLLFFSLGT